MTSPNSYVLALLAQDMIFNIRCQQIAIQRALNIVLMENQNNVANHTARAGLAQRILQKRIQPDMIAQWVLADPNLQAFAIPDAANHAVVLADQDIDSRIQNVWDALSLAAV